MEPVAQALLRQAVVEFADDLPSDWSRAFLRVEIYPDGSGGTLSAFYVPIEEDARRALFQPLGPAHLSRWQGISRAMGSASDRWTSATLTLAPDGTFDLDCGYEPLDGPPFLRQKRWIDQHLEGYRVEHTPGEPSGS